MGRGDFCGAKDYSRLSNRELKKKKSGKTETTFKGKKPKLI